MEKLPGARTSDIVVQNLDGETLVYDLLTNKALCLNETSAAVFNACGSQSSFDDLKRAFKFTDELIFLALDELKRENLLAEDTKFVSPFAGMTRRDALRQVGLATMITLPLITGLIAPKAANAASGAAVACSAPGADCLCLTGTNNNPANSCGAGSASFGFASCQAGCSCISPGICQSNPGCLGTCG